MHRYAVLLLCCGLLACAAVVAAPAPLPRPSRQWLNGWDRPVDSVGDCRFERQGDKLTVTVPGRSGRQELPRLLRAVKGDFIVQVRVSKNLSPFAQGPMAQGVRQAGGPNRVRGMGPPIKVTQFRRAGLFVTDGKDTVWLERNFDDASLVYRGDILRFQRPYEGDPFAITIWEGIVPDGQPAYLRLQRQGDFLKAAVSNNGKKWVEDLIFVFRRRPRQPSTLLQKLKVGVAVEATALGSVKVEFDQFRLTPLGGKTR